MKKVLISFMFLVGVTLLSSCDNNIENDDLSTSSSMEMDDIVSLDSLFSIGNEQFSSWKTGTEETIPSNLRRSSVTDITAYGYSSYTSSGTRKAIIGSDVANYLGIPNQVYVIETLTVYYNLTISGLGTTSYFVSVESPYCGIDPLNSSHIGYAYSPSGETITLATKVHHIISDLSGNSYDRYYPRNPSSLQWNYKLIQLD